MLRVIDRVRSVLVMLVLATLAPYALARTTKPSPSTDSNRTPAGDPIWGFSSSSALIGFFILVAWIFSRMGDDGGRGPGPHDAVA